MVRLEELASGQVHLSPSEILILKSLLLSSKGSSKLRSETALSRAPFYAAIRSLTAKRLVKRKKEQFGKKVTFELEQDKRKEVEIRLQNEPVNLDRYSDLRRIAEEILARQKDPYLRYLMFLRLFSQWGNADLHWVQSQMTWAAIALMTGDRQTYQELRRTAERTFGKCFNFIFELAGNHPETAIGFIESSEDQNIGDVLDDYYPAGDYPNRNDVISEAIEARERLPTYGELSRTARRILTGRSGTGMVTSMMSEKAAGTSFTEARTQRDRL